MRDLDFKKLETRWLQQDLILCCKILFGIVRVDPDVFFWVACYDY